MSKKSEVAVTKDASAPAQHTHWDPFAAMRQQFDRMMQDFDWSDFRFPHRSAAGEAPRGLFAGAARPMPAVDLVERDGAYELQAELPGMSRENIEVKLSDGMMTIRGEKTAETVKDDENIHLRERSYGVFQRSFRLPAGVDADKVSASFDRGVLTVILPKTVESRQKARKVDIAGS
ncbi:Hsp20/alpha crystallin family protein [Pontitalea aquivivens]|uniref:Hsp20/alpha crystallin family protein n=1 Tax=Pontitalea aquivivens TaxID=3388663 RepID=UPI003970E91F